MKRSASYGIKTKTEKDQSLPSVIGSFGEINPDYICQICFNLIQEAHMTQCGHTFCYECLLTSCQQNNKCTQCNAAIKSKEHIYPNFVMNNLIKKQRKKQEEFFSKSKRMKMDSRVWELQAYFANETDDLNINDLDQMVKILQHKKRQMVHDSAVVHNKLLLEFLQDLEKQKRNIIERARDELNAIEIDIKNVKDAMEAEKSLESVVPLASEDIKKEQLVPKTQLETSTSSSGYAGPSKSTTAKQLPESFNRVSTKCKDGRNWLTNTLVKRRRKLTMHFDDLHECYLNTRLSEISFTEDKSVELLQDFSSQLKKFTRFTEIRPIASLSYASDVINTSSIVSSIDFDKDCDHFAVAGVTKKIKIYDYESVVNSYVDGINYPITQMACNSKISCLSWSKYHKSWLASSDYDGSVTLWNAFAAKKVRVFQEHEKRCWSVDFNNVDLRLLASGSDDAHVKLWSTNTEHSVGCIEAKANVCCVKFSPTSSYHLAFGCADHFVHYYDIRNLNQSLAVFRGHKKAVSYAKFVNRDEIVSASTDNELKLWNVNKPNCIRSFCGHLNEKNFVGLATDGNYIACGSENNSLYVYFKGLSKPLLTYQFDVVKSVLDRDNVEDDSTEFVSTVVWPDNSNIIAAANSQGTIKILELV